jgi:undecaprenyl-diphosphatase
LSAAGILIHLSSRYENGTNLVTISRRHFILIRLRFRKFLHSGATISVVMILGVSRNLVEEFSFALAVALTPGGLPASAHP